MALGGQGAPLVPFAEWHLFREYELFLNLGGIANLSVLPRGENGPQKLAHLTWRDTPPVCMGWDLAACNQILNWLAKKHAAELSYDPQGEIAASGQVLPELLAALREQAFLGEFPPRSLGNSRIAAETLPLLDLPSTQPADLLATYVVHLGEVLANELARLAYPPSAILVTGGGAHNTHLITTLQSHINPQGHQLVVPSPALINNKEALAFAFLGLHRLLKKPYILPGQTGSRKQQPSGALSLGGFQ
jgi:anhydro-N-acetylmuramic acid kinase